MAQEVRRRILVVDDSAVMRNLLRTVIGSDSGLEVTGTASDGATALQSLSSSRPDLILLDVEMPVMDGLAALKQMRLLGYRIPVIMCSSLTQRGGRVTVEALASGAADYVTKPAGQTDREAAIEALRSQLLPKIHALTAAKKGAAVAANPAAAPVAVPGAAQIPPKCAPAVVAIGVSTGGPAALDAVLPALPGDFPLPVVIVQHMPELFTTLLAERLNRSCLLRVAEATEGSSLRAGNVYIARGNRHLEVACGGGWPPSLHLSDAPLENHCRPAVDVLYRSLARVYGGAVLAVILTGMGSDGLEGCRLLRGLGATVLAQDEATSAVWGMPGAVAAAGLAARVLPLREMAPEILRLASRTAVEPNGLREAVVQI